MAGRKITSVRLSEARAEYLADMKNLGRAANTVATAKAVLDALERVIGNKVVRNIDKKDVNDYFQARADEGMQQSSLNLHVTRLKLFIRWCEEESYLDQTVRPMRGREQVKVIPRPRSRLVQEDFPVLLDAAENPRDRIALALGIYLMPRSSEIRSLRIGDVSLPDGTVEVVRWKTRRRDTLPISAELHDELESYLAWYRTYSTKVLRAGGLLIDGTPVETPGLSNEWFLAPTNKRRVARYCPQARRFVQRPVADLVLTPDQQMWEQGYAAIVQKALRAIGWTVLPGEGVHTLRRSGARELFDQLRSRTGFDDALLTVMSLLGHARPETTLIYIGVEREAERRNGVLKHNVMFPRAVRANGTVVPLRAVSSDG